jgi:hypothetical protein
MDTGDRSRDHEKRRGAPGRSRPVRDRERRWSLPARPVRRDLPRRPEPHGRPTERVVRPVVVGVGPNRRLSPSRTDLVVSPGETAPFETTYAPFAFPDGAGPDACDGDERTAQIAVVHTSGGSASYTFSYRLEDDPGTLAGGPAEVCSDPETETETIPD